jgi:hypothetical protein
MVGQALNSESTGLCPPLTISTAYINSISTAPLVLSCGYTCIKDHSLIEPLINVTVEPLGPQVYIKKGFPT